MKAIVAIYVCDIIFAKYIDDEYFNKIYPLSINKILMNH